MEEPKVRPVHIRTTDRLLPPQPGDDLRYSVEVEVVPEFTPQNYLQLQLTDPGVEVTEAMVDEHLEQIRQGYATVEDLSDPRPIGPRDLVLIDYRAFANGEEIVGGGHDHTYLEIGSGKFPPEFENQLLGRQPGDEVRFTLAVAGKLLQPPLQEKTIDSPLTIKEVKAVVVPELTDEFVRKQSEKFQSVADLRQAVRRELELKGERDRHENLRQQVIDQLGQHNPIDCPPALVEQELEQILRQQLNFMQRQGLRVTNLNLDQMRERLRPLAEKQVRTTLILDKIAELEGITVTAEDLEASYRRIALQVGDLPETVKKVYEERQMVDELRTSIRAEKTIEFLIDRALGREEQTTETPAQEN